MKIYIFRVNRDYEYGDGLWFVYTKDKKEAELIMRAHVYDDKTFVYFGEMKDLHKQIVNERYIDFTYIE